MATSEERLDVRTLIPDTDAIYGAGANENLFTDDQIDRFFRLGGDSALRAAGLAMIAVGNSEAMIGKVIITQDLETDASKLQDKWRAAGEFLIKRADKGDEYVAFELINYGDDWLPEGQELVDWPFDGRWPYGY